MPLVASRPPDPPAVSGLEAWMYFHPMLTPYVRKLVLNCARRFGVNVTGWPT